MIERPPFKQRVVRYWRYNWHDAVIYLLVVFGFALILWKDAAVAVALLLFFVAFIIHEIKGETNEER